MQLVNAELIHQLSAHFIRRNEVSMAMSHGYVNANWQKDPIRLGYSGDKTGNHTQVATGASETMTGDAVPAGEIWIVEHIQAANLTNNPTTITIVAQINGIGLWKKREAAPGAGIYSIWDGKITLSQSDLIYVVVSGCTVGDNLALRYHAVRVDIDQ